MTWNEMKEELVKRRDGLIIGGLVGAAAAMYVVSLGYDLSSIANAGAGLLDTIMGRGANPLDVAQWKLYAVFIFAGMIIGYLGEWLLWELKILKRR